MWSHFLRMGSKLVGSWVLGVDSYIFSVLISILTITVNSQLTTVHQFSWIWFHIKRAN